ncbi:hypothetical protein C4J83_1528 [Pseudomonas sp. LBUM920]|nr:hypothetical protein C4J83_1528 [Pseudomonas sp. LBUM920]
MGEINVGERYPEGVRVGSGTRPRRPARKEGPRQPRYGWALKRQAMSRDGCRGNRPCGIHSEVDARQRHTPAQGG